MEELTLENIFEEKIKTLEEQENAKRKRIYEINLKYAKEYLAIIKKVLTEIKGLNKPEEIEPISSFIGEFNSKESTKKSEAILRKDSLSITLYFNSNPFKTPLREKEYDEGIINSILKTNGISIETTLPNSNNPLASINIVYSYTKDHKNIPIPYEETRELTKKEANEIIALINTLKEYNLDNYITLGLPTLTPSIYLYKNKTNSWTICNGLTDYGLDNPQFCNTLSRAMQDVFKRLGITKEIKEKYNKILNEIKDTDPEYIIDIYGYSLIKEKRL